MNTKELVAYLDNFLEIDKIPDASLNGLQVEGQAEVTRVGAAVDACLESFEAAASARVELLLVHHGLFWDRTDRLVGNHYRRVKTIIEAGINLYAAHLPLDWHPLVGNNAVLARRIGFEPVSGFGPSGAADGRCIGCIAVAPEAIKQSELLARLSDQLGDDLRADWFGPGRIQRIAVVTGSGAALLPQVAAAGVDAYITGEARHSWYHFSKECRLNVIYGGHYATETFGVIALAEHLQHNFHLPCQFFHLPTGL